jgi:PAS domain S-box-containing protein
LATLGDFLLRGSTDGSTPLLPYFPAILLIGFTCGSWVLGLAVAVAALMLDVCFAFGRGQALSFLLPQYWYALVAFVLCSGLLLGNIRRNMRMHARLRQLEQESRTATETAQLTDERFRVALAGIPVFAWECGPDRRYRWAYSSVPGIVADSLIGKELGSVRPPSSYAGFWDAMERVWTEGVRLTLPVEWTHEGAVRHFVSSIEPLKLEDGTVAGLRGAAVDVTRVRLAEEALRASEEKFSKAFAASPDGLAISRLEDGVLVDVNERFLELFGLTRQQAVGQPSGALGIRGEGNLARPALEELRKTGSLRCWETTLPRPTGDSISVQVSSEMLSIGGARCILSHVRDITGEQTRLQELRDSEQRAQQLARQLEEAARQKDAFLATLAHELRNPLAPIRYATRLLEPGTPPEMAAGARQMIDRQLAQMAHLLDDLLDVSRITHGRLELRMETLDLVKAVENAAETARPLMSSFNHTLEVRVPNVAVAVRADATRLAQILGNVLNNAAKYTDPKGTIAIELLLHEEARASVRIRDSGVGIPRELLPRIFDLFSQGAHGSRAQGGLGIGLALARQLAELHDGTLIAESEGHQRGSTFTLTLPRLSEPAAVLNVPDHPAPRALFAERAPVLIADDNVDAALSLAQVLQLAGFSTHVVHDGASAQDAAERLRPAIILLDIGMPKLDGHAVAQWIRSQPWGRRTCLIAITGWGQESDRRATAGSGFDAHLTKPVDPDRLIELLASVAGGSGMPSSAASERPR